MKFDVVFERVFPQHMGEVWHALTEARALSAWLNETDDFEPVVGHRFTMRCTGDDGHEDVYLCQVLELEPERFMAWSWLLQTPKPLEPTRLEFTLETLTEGTRLRIRHLGDRDPEVVERFRSGWPSKLDEIALVLAQPSASATGRRRT